MCDLVKQETERIDSRFLEPACGEGAFLTEILRRKLAVVKNKYGKSPFDYERYAVLAITSIYGVDILEDNTEICRQKLFGQKIEHCVCHFRWRKHLIIGEVGNAGQHVRIVCRNI